MEELFNQFGWRVTLETAALPDGRVKKDVVIHRCDAVDILAVQDDGNVVIIREFRPFFGQYIWMLPSGKVDKETDLLTAAHRELREETGFAAEVMIPFGTTNFTDSIDITHHLFIAKKLRVDPLPQDEDELIEVHTFPLQEAIDLVLSSPRVHASSALTLLKYAREQHS